MDMQAHRNCVYTVRRARAIVVGATNEERSRPISEMFLTMQVNVNIEV